MWDASAPLTARPEGGHLREPASGRHPSKGVGVPSPTSPHAARLRDVLEPWCAAGATGALRVTGPPGGAIFLTGGRLTNALTPARHRHGTNTEAALLDTLADLLDANTEAYFDPGVHAVP
jgi:hypothetical protein